MDNENNETPTVQELAQAAEASYSMTRNGKKQDRLEHAQSVAPEGYNIMPQYTDRMISTFKHNDFDTYIIAHRGTDIGGSQTKKDIQSDWNIITGSEDSDLVHQKRTKKTETIIKELMNSNSNNPIDIYLSSHSLGSSTAHHAMVNSKIVRDNVKELHTFNAGSSPFQSQKLDRKSPEYKIIKEKSTHHHIKGDLISDNTKKSYIGTHKTYSTKKKVPVHKKVIKVLRPLLLGGWGIAWNMKENLEERLGNHSIANFTGR